MTNKELLETYGKSVDEIRLDIASRIYIKWCADGLSEEYNREIAAGALRSADIFVQCLTGD